VSTILLALGLVMIVEGLAYALAPSLIERMLEMLQTLPEQAVRQIGLLIVVTGFMLVWLAWHLGGL
jgi:uncharacterized protein YjeT (DUF2065 family)